MPSQRARDAEPSKLDPHGAQGSAPAQAFQDKG
eukprot:CAMPEP_0118940690 /NCGR_PEP_ID=MMETSP1169-20130426/32040_1 /TAXON_ID=36882 /ORGANISM="Pyramimonas obovata, Strain CCMP722" /LENGTH=32 /DNA_ID= /DNA_START= /DNA_END= /DNA_ORIENTATION=